MGLRYGAQSSPDATAPARGVVLLCAVDGALVEVIRDDFGLAEGKQRFPLLVDPGSLGKALSLLLEVRTHGFACGWELNCPSACPVETLAFVGRRSGENLLVIGAETHQALLDLEESFLQADADEEADCQDAWKRFAAFVAARTATDSALRDQLTSLNNELVNLQRQLTKQNVELENLNQLKNRFLGMAAHDLRTPLGAIMSFSDFLLDETADVLNAEHREFLSIIRASSDRMLKLVGGLLEVSAIEAGKLQLDLSSVDLALLAEQVVAVHRVLSAPKGVSLSLSHAAGLRTVVADGAKITQVLDNLISNAVKFSPTGGAVEIALAQDAGGVLFSVRDHGKGIPSEELGKLFRPFSTTSVKSTASEKSTGLGLAIVKRLVEGHRGKVWVESEIGEGSTFFVSLPAGQGDNNE